MENNVYRNAKMGTWVLIYDDWYYHSPGRQTETIDIIGNGFL